MVVRCLIHTHTHTHTHMLLTTVKALRFKNDILILYQNRFKVNLTFLLFLFYYHSNMKGKRSRVTTMARECIVTGSLEIPEAQPAVSNHYYYS